MNDRSAGKWIEISWPWIAASAAAVIALCAGQRFALTADSASRLVEKLVDFCSVGIGFWSTALALLLALDSRRTVAGLKSLDIYTRVVGFFLSSVYASFVLLVLCLVTIASGRPLWFPRTIFGAAWAFAPVFTLASMLRSFRLLGKLLRAR